MDEFKIIFWIIVLVIYLVSRSRKKQSEQPSIPPAENQPGTGTPKPMSFEDLLREIQASKAPKQQPVQEVKTATRTSTPQRPAMPRDYQDYDDEVEEDEKDLEDVNYDYKKKDEIYDTYEKAKQEAFVKPSLEETIKLEDTVVKFGQFKGYTHAPENTVARDILAQFNDPEGFRRAFIMSEILKRKF